jgi:hypothetical protein
MLRRIGLLCALVISMAAGQAYGAKSFDYPALIRDLEGKPSLSDTELVRLGKLHQQMGEMCDMAATVAAETILDQASCVSLDREPWGAEYFSALASLELLRLQQALDTARAGIQRRRGPDQLLTLMSVLRAVADCRMRKVPVTIQKVACTSLIDSLEAASQVFLTSGIFPLSPSIVAGATSKVSSLSLAPLIERASLAAAIASNRLDEAASALRGLEQRGGIPMWQINTQCCEMQFCDPSLYRIMAHSHYALARKSLGVASRKSLLPKNRFDVAVFRARAGLLDSDTLLLSQNLAWWGSEYRAELQPYQGWLLFARGDKVGAHAIWSKCASDTATPRTLIDVFSILSRFNSEDGFADSMGRALVDKIAAGKLRERLQTTRMGQLYLMYAPWAMANWQIFRGRYDDAAENIQLARAASRQKDLTLDNFTPSFCLDYSGALLLSGREDFRLGGFGGFIAIEPVFTMLNPLMQSSRLLAACASRSSITQREKW